VRLSVIVQRLLQKTDDRGKYFLARQCVQLHVGGDSVAQRRQRSRELDDVLVLVFVAQLAPFRVVAVLLAATRIEPGRLDVAIGRGSTRIRRLEGCRLT
jgi:hypothetical protein